MFKHENATNVSQLKEQINSIANEIAGLPYEAAAEIMTSLREKHALTLFETGVLDMARFPEENPNPVIRISMDGDLLYKNNAAEILLGPGCQVNQPAPPYFQQLANEFTPDCPGRTIEYEVENRIFLLDVVPVYKTGYINIYARDITPQKQVESTREQLLADNQRQQALLDAIFEAEPSGLAVITGPDLQIAFANPAYRFICPKTGEDIVGLKYDEIWAEEPGGGYTEQIKETFETGRPFIAKGFERNFPGEYTRIFTLQARRMQWGALTAVLVILWDTTEQSLSEAKYRDLAESITDNFVAYDKNLRCIYRNQASKKYSKIRTDQMIGKTFEELFPEMVGSIVHRTYLQVLKTRQRKDIETTWVRPEDGQTMAFDVHIYPTQEGIAVFSKDITAKKQSELLLRASEQRERARRAELEALMDTVPAVIWITRDRDSREMYGNRAGYEFLRLPEGTNISKSAPPDVLARQAHRNYQNGIEIPVSELPMQKAASSGNPAEDYEFDVVFNDGQTRTLYGNVVPLRDDSGEPAGALGAFIDITGRKAAEEQLHESQKRLSILSEAAADFLAGVDPITRLNEFFNHFAKQLGLEVYVQYNLVGGHLELGSWAGFPEKYRRLLGRLELGQAVCGTVAQTQRAMIVEDVQQTNDHRTELIRRLGIRTYACHPLIAGGRLLGTLSFGSRKYDRLPRETIALLRTFCHLVATAMERKQAEEEAQAHQKQYMDLLRNTNAVFYEVDFTTRRFTSVNDAMSLLSGYSRDELLAMDPFDLLDEDSQRLFRLRIQQWMSGEKPDRLVEYKVRTKDGQIRYALLNVVFKKNAEGGPLGASVVAQDITERKQIEIALQKTQERFREVLENSQDVAYRRDLRTDRYDYMSPVVEEVLGFSVDALERMSIEEITQHIHPDDRPLVVAGIEGVGTTGRGKLIYRFRKPDGTYRWVADLFTHTVDESGQPAYRTGILRDISEDIEVDQQLLRDKRILAQAGQMAQLGAWEVPVSRSGVLRYDQMYWSDGVYWIFGYETGAVPLTKELFTEHITPEDREKVFAAIEQAIEDHEPFAMEFHINKQNDGQRTLAFSGEALLDEMGYPVSVAGAVQDITSLRQLESSQWEYRTQLEVQRRLLEQREQERLRIARDLHDGPTQELIGALFSLKEAIDRIGDPDIKNDLENLQQRLKQQAAELRAYTGQLRPTMLDNFGLIKAIQSHAESFQEQHPEIHIHIEENRKGELVSKEFRLALFRIYQEALANIARHSQATQVEVRLIKEDDTLSLLIGDNGSGFTQPLDWLALAREGHLGLVGMRERAEAIGGKLTVENRPGGGSLVRVVISLQKKAGKTGPLGYGGGTFSRQTQPINRGKP